MKKIVAFLSVILLILPIAVSADSTADRIEQAYDNVPWYARGFVYIIDLFLGLLGGVRDPMDHVFNGGCSTFDGVFNDCQDLAVWGVWTTEYFNNYINRGFWLMATIGMALIIIAIVKNGVMFSFSSLSPMMRVSIGDTLIKVFIATLLMTQFYNIVGTMFQVNNLAVNMFEQELRGNITVRDGDGNILPRAGAVISNDRILMQDLTLATGGTNGLDDVMIILFTKGISIWWEVFYLQRTLMISILVILAPLWIACMFTPFLGGITSTALKELWAQCISQCIHAALFWLFFGLFQADMSWLNMLIALAIFIPISESVRFIFGATSQTGSNLARAGTLVGAGAMINLVGAASSIGKGISRGVGAFKGATSATGASNAGRAGASLGETATAGMPMHAHAVSGGHNKMDRVMGMKGGSTTNNIGSSPIVTSKTKSLRAVSEVASGLGGAAFRMGGAVLGAGVGGGIGMYMGGNVGEKLGDGIGYRAGATAYGGGSVVAGASKSLANMPKAYKEARKASHSRRAAAGYALRGGINKVRAENGELPAQEQMEYEAQQLEKSAERFGVAGEALFGRGGYEKGDAFARSRMRGRQPTASMINSLKKAGINQVYTVETNASSVLAYKDKNGEYVPISNYKRGNPNLRNGETLVSSYNIKGSGDHVHFEPAMSGSPNITPNVSSTFNANNTPMPSKSSQKMGTSTANQQASRQQSTTNVNRGTAYVPIQNVTGGGQLPAPASNNNVPIPRPSHNLSIPSPSNNVREPIQNINVGGQSNTSTYNVNSQPTISKTHQSSVQASENFMPHTDKQLHTPNGVVSSNIPSINPNEFLRSDMKQKQVDLRRRTSMNIKV